MLEALYAHSASVVALLLVSMSAAVEGWGGGGVAGGWVLQLPGHYVLPGTLPDARHEPLMPDRQVLPGGGGAGHGAVGADLSAYSSAGCRGARGGRGEGAHPPGVLCHSDGRGVAAGGSGCPDVTAGGAPLAAPAGVPEWQAGQGPKRRAASAAGPHICGG